MKVIKNNYQKPREKAFVRICDKCRSIFEHEKKDCEIVGYLTLKVICPCCKNAIYF